MLAFKLLKLLMVGYALPEMPLSIGSKLLPEMPLSIGSKLELLSELCLCQTSI